MLCYVMLYYVMLCYVMLCYVMLCYVMLCHVMLCYVMLCHVTLCYVMFCYTFSLNFILFHCFVLHSFIFYFLIIYYSKTSYFSNNANLLAYCISVEDMAERCITQSWLDRQHFHKTNPFRGQHYRGWIYLHTFCYVTPYERCECNASLDVRNVLCSVLQYWIGCGCLYHGTCQSW